MRKTTTTGQRQNGRVVAAAVGAGGPMAAASAAAYLVQSERARKEELLVLRREHKEMQQALFEAAQIQRKLCAPREMRRGAFEIAGEMFPVRHLSGDFLKVLDLGPAVGLILGDIAGKGISAGLWLAHLVGLARSHAERHAEVAAAMAGINRELCGLMAEPPMAGLFLGRLEPLTGELVYCNAGQPPALLLRRDGAVESLSTGGPMLGAMPEAAFETGRALLEPGDTLMACTDGVVECRNVRDEEFGTKRLATLAGAAGGASAGQRLFSTLGAVLDYAGGRPLDDDLTLMVVQRRE